MNRTLTTALLASGLIAFSALGIANITKTNHKFKTQDIQLKSKQSDLQLLELKFNKLNVDLEKERGAKTQDQQRIDELQRQKQELQKQLDDAQAALQAKAKQKADEEQKLARAASTALGTQKAYAASGDVESIIRSAANRYGVSGDMLMRIARCESGLNPNAVAKNYIAGTHPTGLFQHVAAYWPQRAVNYGHAGASIFDTTAQAEVTAQMFRDGHSKLWECK